MQAAGSRSLTLFGLVLVAVLAGVFLREGARGIAAHLPRPNWSPHFVGSWLLCSATLAALLVAPGVLHSGSALGPAQALVHSAVTGGWSEVPAVLMVGLVLTASLHGVRRLLYELVRLHRRVYDVRWSPVATCGAPADLRRPTFAPLTVGWSDRGPPVTALAAF